MPVTYRQIGVASTFSPRFLAVLAEADRIARNLDAPLSIVHAGAKDETNSPLFRGALDRLQREAPTPVIWAPMSASQSPADAIVEACAAHGIDLLLAGALERETELRNFTGGVARELLQRAPCDLLLVPKPEDAGAPCDVVAIEVDINQPPASALLTRACEIATRLHAKDLVFIGVVTPFREAKAATGRIFLNTPEERLTAIVDKASGFDGRVDCRLIESNTGFSVCDFVQDTGVDLLVVPAQIKDGPRRLPAHMDWLLQVIPTDVLLLGVSG